MGGHVGSGHGGGGGRDRGGATLCSEGSIEPRDLNIYIYIYEFEFGKNEV